MMDDLEQRLRAALVEEAAAAPQPGLLPGPVRAIPSRRSRGWHVGAAVTVGALVAGVMVTANTLLNNSPPDARVAVARPASPDVGVQRLTKSPLEPRETAGTVWTGQSVVVWGGEGGEKDNDRLFGDGAEYDPASRSWSILPQSPLSARRCPAVTWSGRYVFVWGGQDGDGRELLDGALYDPSTRAWQAVPSAPEGRGCAKGISSGDGKVFLVSGSRQQGPNPRAAGILLFDFNTRMWTSVTQPDDVYDAALVADQLYLVTMDPASGVVKVDRRGGVGRMERLPDPPVKARPDFLGIFKRSDDDIQLMTTAGDETLIHGLKDGRWERRASIPADKLTAPTAVFGEPGALAMGVIDGSLIGLGRAKASIVDGTGDVVSVDLPQYCGAAAASVVTDSELFVWSGQDCLASKGRRHVSDGYQVTVR